MLGLRRTREVGEGKEQTVPIRNVLVGNTRGDIKHDDTTLPIDVVTVSQTTKFLLTCCVPDVEVNLAEVLDVGSVRMGSGCER